MSDSDKRATQRAEDGSCEHPADQMQPVSTGTVCTACGESWGRGAGAAWKTDERPTRVVGGQSEPLSMDVAYAAIPEEERERLRAAGFKEVTHETVTPFGTAQVTTAQMPDAKIEGVVTADWLVKRLEVLKAKESLTRDEVGELEVLLGHEATIKRARLLADGVMVEEAPDAAEEAWLRFAAEEEYDSRDYDYSEQRRFWLMGYDAARGVTVDRLPKVGKR